MCRRQQTRNEKESQCNHRINQLEKRGGYQNQAIRFEPVEDPNMIVPEGEGWVKMEPRKKRLVLFARQMSFLGLLAKQGAIS